MADILLTGAGGYLGSAVAAALDAAGADWAPLGTRLEAITPGSLSAHCVIHCAGALRARPERLQHDNVQGTAHLLAGLRDRPRVLFASSRSVYGAEAGLLCAETHTPTPRDDYGRSKFAAEQLLRASGLPVLCCRLATLFGPAPRGHCPALPNLAWQRWQHGEAVHLVPDDFEVDYLAVSDAARLLVALATTPWPCDAVNLPGPVRSVHTLMRALAGVARTQGLKAELAYDHAGSAVWPRLDGRRLQQWLPAFRHSSDAEVGRAWLQAGGNASC